LGTIIKRKTKGDSTAPREIKIKRLMYIKRRTIATMRNKIRKTKVIKEVVPVMNVAGLMASTIQA
jgi:hypothetical protein